MNKKSAGKPTGHTQGSGVRSVGGARDEGEEQQSRRSTREVNCKKRGLTKTFRSERECLSRTEEGGGRVKEEKKGGTPSDERETWGARRTSIEGRLIRIKEGNQ